MNDQTNGTADSEGAPVAEAKMTPVKDRTGVGTPWDVLYLDDIPGAMDKMGWTVSARLMRHWFSIRPEWKMEAENRGDTYGKEDTDGKYNIGDPIIYSNLPPTQVEDQIVKMDWAMGFDRFREVFNDLRKPKNYASKKGLDVLRDRLTAVGWIPWRPGMPKKEIKLGHQDMSAKELDLTCQINFREVGGLTDPFDDFFGAIGSAVIKVAVFGKAYVEYKEGEIPKDVFLIEKIGFYIRDTYDFNAKWWMDSTIGLGVWSKEGVLDQETTKDFVFQSVMPPPYYWSHKKYPGYVPISNRDFRRWQDVRKEGGDFYVFSDVKWVSPLLGENTIYLSNGGA